MKRGPPDLSERRKSAKTQRRSSFQTTAHPRLETSSPPEADPSLPPDPFTAGPTLGEEDWNGFSDEESTRGNDDVSNTLL